MARKEKQSNAWVASDRVGAVTLFKTKRSPFWWMYWTERTKGNAEGRGRNRSTRETDLALARIVAARQNEDLFTRERYPELVEKEPVRIRVTELIGDFVSYLERIGRTHDHIKNVSGRLSYLAEWMKNRRHRYLAEITPVLLQAFMDHLKERRGLAARTVNHYLDAVHNFFGYVIYKRRLMKGPNPAEAGRQAELDRLADRSLPPPTIYPDQVNAVINVAMRHGDLQVANLILFICEGGFRIQELQFLQVGDIHFDRHEIALDIKLPDPKRVRPELRKRCLTSDGYWMPKTAASRRVVHITDRLAKVIRTMEQGDSSDWVFMNQAGNQIAGNKTLLRLKRYALEADVLVANHPKTGEPWSLIKWHWLRHYHRTRAHVSKIRREVSKIAMGHAADSIHDHYRGLDSFAFHEEYAKFDSGINVALFDRE